MSKVKVIQLIFMLILSGKSFAGPPPKLSQKSLHLQSRLSYFQTDANYESEGGSFVNLGGDRSYKNLNAQLGAFYTFANDLGLFTELNFANATSVATDFERTNTEFTEITGGFNYQWFNQPVEIIPTAHLTIPFNRIDIATDEVLTGEGAIQVLLGSWIAKNFDPFYIFGFLGYNYRDEGRSTQLPWAIGSELEFGSIFLGAEVHGHQKVSDDEFTDTPPQRTQVTNRVNAGSLAFYSINSSLLAFELWGGMSLSKQTQIYAGYEQSIDGKNAAAGNTFFVGLNMEFDLKKNHPKTPSTLKKRKRKSQELENFKIESEKYDENLFDRNRQRQKRRQKIKEKNLLNETEKFLEGQ